MPTSNRSGFRHCSRNVDVTDSNLRRLRGVGHLCSDRVPHPLCGVVNASLAQQHPRRRACALLTRETSQAVTEVLVVVLADVRSKHLVDDRGEIRQGANDP